MAKALQSLLFYLITSACMISLMFAQDQFEYYDFSKANLSLDGMATILPNGLLQLTNNATKTTGHAFYKVPIEFNTSSSTSAESLSFSTEFVFAIVPEAKSRGQGMAFVVSPTPDLSHGGATSYLGFVNITTNNKTDTHILAIELDTNGSADAADINDNHVGIDVNSIYSIQSANASYFNDTNRKNDSLLLASGKSILIWIEYDGTNKVLDVTLAPVQTTRPRFPRSIKPSLPLLSRSINLSEIFLEEMFIGFSGSTGTITSNQYILGWSFKKGGKAKSLDMSKIIDPPTPPLPQLPPQSTTLLTERLVIIISITSAIVVLMIIGGVMYLYQKNKYAEVLEEWEKEYSPQRLSFRTLFKATKGFKENRLLGAGGFGKVYKGELPSGIQIAVKRVSHDVEQGMQQYVAEVASMGRLRHKNLVQLLGYCRRKGELLLVYDYMPNGSLDDYLFNTQNPKSLSLSQRFHIVKGVASALLYLHEDWEQVVLHRDIKASNILLDANLNGKLGDFGLARFHDRGMNIEATRVVGTIGYMAPELTAMGVATTWTDVYAFGAFMLEVVCGRRPVDPDKPREEMILIKWVATCGKNGVLMDTVDSKLEGNFSAKEAELLLKLGMLCSQSNPENRPSMRQMIQYLEGNASIPDISFDTYEFGIPNICERNNETGTTQTTTSSLANFSYDTVTVLFGGR
ncbi:putative L-type lectin-domain containing receptor kinase II.2 [Cardamine amara subsp. amara]|uniref:non-specific serine/threonine protein kinase n=1 Tax=Cardamine amara subsp. amara TaxID=228776 RepID=A0ABD1BSS4_CARAN